MYYNNVNQASNHTLKRRAYRDFLFSWVSDQQGQNPRYSIDFPSDSLASCFCSNIK